MIKYEDECVDCGKPCLGRVCPNLNVKHLYCDRCGAEEDSLWKYEGEELCKDCIYDAITEVLEEIR